jgi:hypothetical protein
MAACSRGGPGEVSVAFNVDGVAGSASRSVVRFALHDPQGRPIEGAHVRLEGHMTHPGMAPAIADASEVRPGVYEAQPVFTMPGEWTFLVSGVLADGTPITGGRQQSAPRISVRDDMVRRPPDPGGTP